jgi:hypothetical protein
MATVTLTCPYCKKEFKFDMVNTEGVPYPSSGSAYVIPSGGSAVPSGVFAGQAGGFRNMTCPYCGKVIGIDSDEL